MTAAHQPLLNALTTLPDLQTSWLLLLYCASPRAHYALRGIRPDLTGTYATAHDAAVLACLAQLLDHQHGALPEHASHRAHLALDQGGLGLRSAHHHTAAAYWASWHDVAPIIQRKSPNLFTHITEQLTTPVDSATPSIQCLQHVQEFLRNLGLEAPAWAECAPPGPPTQAELPQQLRRWQQAASKVIDQAYANFVEASADPAGQALLESQRGPHASRTFTLLPTSPELTFEPAHFRVLLLRRLRLPLPHTTARCRCHRPHDQLGDHRAACPHSGALRTRRMALEKAMARVCREAGAAVSTNVLARDLNTTTRRTDERRIEVIANALPFWHGAQLAVDTTLVSPLTASSQVRRSNSATAGAALRIARRSKARTYPELTQGGRARLVVFAMELGGCWSEEAATFIRMLAQHRARDTNPLLRKAAQHAWTSRWAALPAAAAMRSFACSLLHLPGSSSTNVDGPCPLLSDTLTGVAPAPHPSRLSWHSPA